MNDQPLVMIFSTVWPEPESSAAGVRQMHWIQFFLGMGYRVTLISPSKLKKDIPDVELLPLPLNRSEAIEILRSANPQIVMFDRFIVEEQYGHYVYESCKNALVLLETQDLHFVRRAREGLRESLLSQPVAPDFYKTETALRETASIERVDYSFLVSSFEEKILEDTFEIGSDRICYIPFWYESPILEAFFNRSFSERRGFVWIGNFRHAPNVDGLRWFRSEIWPLIRKVLPKAELRISGAYPSKEVMEWNRPKIDGISVLGEAKSLEEVFENGRVNLAPLRFGAGVKGKLIEGFRHGLPAVSTWLGEEGLLSDSSFSFPGEIANSPETFAKACVALHEQEETWNEKHERARVLLEAGYDAQKIKPKLKSKIEELLLEKQKGDLPRWRSQMLRHEISNSHRYFSKWIEAKEAGLGNPKTE